MSIPIDPAENAIPVVGTRAIGTVIQLSVFDASVNEILAAKFDRIVVERSQDDAVTWEEATTPATRPALQKDQQSYIFRDFAGNENWLYRVRYFSTQRNELSQAGEPVLGSGLAIRNILTVAQLKSRYLFGIDLTNDDGVQLEDAVFEHYIIASIRWLERQIDVPILPTRFLEAHDFYIQDYSKYGFILLDYYPVISVAAFNVKYTSSQNLLTYPLEWLRLDKNAGQLQIVPTAGNLSEVLIGQSGNFLSVLYGGSYQFPQLYEVDYVAGFGAGLVPRDIVDAIGMLAALGPLGIFGDLITGAGIGNLSLSMDGLSQSVTTTQSAMYGGYGSRVNQYSEAVKKSIPIIRSSLKRVGGMVVA